MASLMLKIYIVVKVTVQINSSMCWIKHHEKKACGVAETRCILARTFIVGCRLRLKCDGTRAETRFYLRRNGRVHLNGRGRQFSRLLAAEMCGSKVVMLDTPCYEVV